MIIFLTFENSFFRTVDHSVRKLSQQGNRARCASHGVWKPPVTWTRQIWWLKSSVSLISTAVTTNNVKSFCYSVSMVTHTRARWYIGKWRSVSCLDYHWTVSASNGFQDPRLPSRTLRRRLPMSYSYNTSPWFHTSNVFNCGVLKDSGNRDYNARKETSNLRGVWLLWNGTHFIKCCGVVEVSCNVSCII